MPNYSSPYWDEELGECRKHRLPQTPCPACIAEQDPDMEVRPTEMEKITRLFDDPGPSTHPLPKDGG